MDGRAPEAALEVARRKVNRANGLLREAARELAIAVTGDIDVVGVQRVHDARSAEAVAELVTLARGLHGTVDVVVIRAPQRRA